MEIKDNVISARVTSDTAKRLRSRLEREGMTMSEFLGRYAIDGANGDMDFRNMNIEQGITMANGGGIPTPSPIPLNENVAEILGAIGGLTTGSIVYKTLVTFLPEDIENEERELIALTCSIVSGVGAVVGLRKVLKRNVNAGKIRRNRAK